MSNEQQPKRKIQQIEVTFADEHSRISYEIQHDVERELAKLRTLGITDLSLGSDGGYFLTPISFGTDAKEKGEATLFYIDDFMNLEEDEGSEYFYVRPTTLRVLDELGIPYKDLSEKDSE